ncbi:AAA family ATPase [uncultured Roseobacter sp.]|uniref:AAA family ATPase n=1 Tax=uncultured Roseobacter sp. TaxID=114847 RepID=UPI00261C911B|nr:AAA family ATPase [uncultured Roseobacter sp.]
MIETRKILISGCSGGGKSTLLTALARRGYATVPEPGRRIVAEELRADGAALPWINPHAFSLRALHVARSDLDAAESTKGVVFFDRGMVDAAVACEHAGGRAYLSLLAGSRHYDRRVFLAPPWPEIFVTDAERRGSLEDAKAEYARLVAAFSELGYVASVLPKTSVADRVDFVLSGLGIGEARHAGR